MKTFKLLKFFWLPVLLLLLSCFHSKQHESTELAVFQNKADLKTEQIYHQLMEQNQRNQEVSLFLKCDSFNKSQRDALESLQVKIGSVSENIVTARLPVAALPAVAKLQFITAIESAKKAKLKY